MRIHQTIFFTIVTETREKKRAIFKKDCINILLECIKMHKLLLVPSRDIFVDCQKRLVFDRDRPERV